MTWQRAWLTTSAAVSAVVLLWRSDDLDFARALGCVVFACLVGAVVALGFHLRQQRSQADQAKQAKTTSSPRFDATECRELATAALGAKLDRQALLNGLPDELKATLPRHAEALDQLLWDVQTLNHTSARPGHPVHPLVGWMTNALAQATRANQPQAKTFEHFISLLMTRLDAWRLTAGAGDYEDLRVIGQTIGAAPSEPTAAPSVFLTHRSTAAVAPENDDRSRIPDIVLLHQHLSGRLGCDRVFLSSVSLKPGDVWFERLQRHLSGASVLVAWLTDDFEKSAWVGYEVGVAEGRKARIVPVFVGSEGNVPEFIKKNQGITFKSHEDVANHILKLLSDESAPGADPKRSVH